jgi:hypothetical protein
VPISPRRHERLTDEQLRAAARSFTEQSIEAAAVNEAIALRARVAKLEVELGDAEDRVAKLEAALEHARGVIEAIMSDGNCDCRKDFAIIDAALNKAAP